MGSSNVVKTVRDAKIARRVYWATHEAKLNPRAVEYAKRYLNLNETMLKLISNYENATDLPAGQVREDAQRAAWDATIQYIRTFSSDDLAA
jgi:hypothetical protein